MTQHLYSIKNLTLMIWQNDVWRSFLIGVVSVIIVIPQLGDIYLWMDEAETAVLGKNILTYGYPRMYDGRNLMSYYPPLHNEDYVEVVLPWLQYYVSAASFGLLGIDTFTARLPFALLGIASLIFFPFLVRRLTQDRWVFIVAPLLLTGWIPFLLYFRQCRYYGLVIFCTLWVLWAYLCLGEKRKWATVHLVIASILLFHSHYVVCAGTLIGLGMHWLVLYRDRISIQTIAKATTIFLLFTVPWILYTEFWTHDYTWFSIRKLFVFTGTLTAKLFHDFAPPLLVSAFAFLLIDKRCKFWFATCLAGGISMAGVILNLTGFPIITACLVLASIAKGILFLLKTPVHRELHIIWLVPAGVILTLSLLSPSNEIRYLVGIAPLAILGLTLAISGLRKINRRLAITVLVVIWGCNIFNVLPSRALAMLPINAWDVGVFITESDWAVRVGLPRYLPDNEMLFHRMAVIDNAIEKNRHLTSYPGAYLYQIINGYKGPSESITEYVNANSDPDDTIITDYGSVPLMFYTKLRILPEDLLYESSLDADWVILHSGDFVSPPVDVLNKLKTNYRLVDLALPDILWDNRPELEYHYFQVPTEIPGLEIYHKID